MPLILLALGVAGIGGTFIFAKSAGDSAGTETGKGLADALTIVGIGVGVGVIIYAAHKK